MVKNPPCNAGVTGLMAGGGINIPHAWGQLSQHAATIEPTQIESAHHNKDPMCHN